jgi:hypothetical protein
VAPNNCLPYTSELCGITNSASCAICKLNSDSGETYSDRCIGYTKNVVCEDGEDINYNLSGPFVGPAGCVCPLQFLYCGPTNGCKPIECPVAGGCSGNSYCKRTIANSGQVCEQKWIECPEMCFNNGNIITKFRIQQIEGYGTGIDSFVSGCMDTNQCLGEGKTNCGDGTCCINGSVCNPFGGCLKLNISASSAESNLNESYPSVGLFGLNSEKSPSVLDSVFSQITGFFANLLNMFS